MTLPDHLIDVMMDVLQLGEAFAGDDSVIIAKLDATANDVPSDKFQARTSAICCALPVC